ncbi:Exosome complex component rrp4 [Gracilariopsis chorda]|uniref:Exosome complex component rrp4 n=1 Tax=Gracilariopsis chorda TaxID=448386 RepID=A0A2V3IDP5_9FLOR|nr:Exosome complex component rrp4 [Gracilariopsis chorda]|eukprot:PXF40187.1 Exosome complex component rrp4 [Gracilariopsis chorda]
MEAQRSSSASFTILRPKRLSDNAEAVSRLSHVPITSPGSVILTEDHSVRARRTLLSCGESGNVLTATRAGVISRVNKLVMVMPLRSPYILETGDVVGGRVVEISSKLYKMDVNATKLAFLLLTAIKLPGGVRRRRNQEDEINMRESFREGDLVSAEVQERRKDGSVALHARMLRYRKLSGGRWTVGHLAIRTGETSKEALS